ncbi:MAG: hypothetical protein ACOCUI_05930 [bacterium]
MKIKIKKIIFITCVLLFCTLLITGCATNNKNYDKTVELPSISSINKPPTLNISKDVKIIDSNTLRDKIHEETGLSYYAADKSYFTPTKKNMQKVIRYLDDIYYKMEIKFIPEGNDCDDYANTKANLAKLIISQAYGIESSPTIFVIFVYQNESWAGVQAGGGHAVCVFACINENKNNKIEIYVWEPQNTEIIASSEYPNRSIFYVGEEADKTDKYIYK